ncbi:MAG: OmpA family protein [Propionivibrio sp.]|nr:OmpA family protein [Propionivibrio sp.]MBK9027447.1 OmpA family protein [Propionivibrio sp.]HRC59960.1 OmpA family protein [Candidatus Propionivibrio aalborgensis]
MNNKISSKCSLVAMPYLVILALLGACSTEATMPADPDQSAQKAAPPAPPPPSPILQIPILPHDEAVLKAANTLFSKAELAGDPADKTMRRPVVIDPLIDGVSRMQTAATRKMETNVANLVKAKYPQFEVKPFTAANLGQSPLLVVGTFTPINQLGKTEGVRESYRFCLALVDLKSRRIVSKAVARSRMENVDSAPLPFFSDAPVWTRDPTGEAYVATCQASKLDGEVSPAYIDSLVADALINEGIRAYNSAHFKEALALFVKAGATPAGQQFRTLTGNYLAASKLGRRQESAQAFGRIVDFGLDAGKLSVVFTFRPGATSLHGGTAKEPYDMWLKSLAQHAAQRNSCMEIIGHASRGGPESVNERLSALRAEYVRQRLVDETPSLDKRLIAAGYGSRENLIGTGKDNASDALDRRVEFRLLACRE